MQKIKTWAFGLLREELTSTKSNGTITEIREVSLFGLVIKRVVTTRAAGSKPPAPVRVEGPTREQAERMITRMSELDVVDKPAQVDRLGQAQAQMLPVTVPWVNRHYRGHIINNLAAGVEPRFIRQAVVEMAHKKISRHQQRWTKQRRPR